MYLFYLSLISARMFHSPNIDELREGLTTPAEPTPAQDT